MIQKVVDYILLSAATIIQTRRRVGQRVIARINQVPSRSMRSIHWKSIKCPADLRGMFCDIVIITELIQQTRRSDVIMVNPLGTRMSRARIESISLEHHCIAPAGSREHGQNGNAVESDSNIPSETGQVVVVLVAETRICHNRIIFVLIRGVILVISHRLSRVIRTSG